MNLSYRTRRFLKNAATAALCLVLAAVVVWMVWIVWLDRYVVYSRDGVQFDMNLSVEHLQGGHMAVAPDSPSVPIFYNDGADAIDTNTELVQLTGYYADTAALRESISEVRRQIETFPAGTPVMIDVKNKSGYFHYTTSVGLGTSGSLDIGAMDSLIQYLNSSSLYTIARIPAFNEYLYFSGDKNLSHGLEHSSGRGLFMDSTDRTYFLNPASSGALTYIIQIINELKGMGFDEVVLDGFAFPNTQNINFKGDKTETLAAAARTIANACADDSFCVSFTASSKFVLPEGRCRLYLTGVDAADVKATVNAMEMEDKDIRVVFVTEAMDTRFNDYGVMRPTSAARFTEG